jgi:hypothetical protein
MFDMDKYTNQLLQLYRTELPDSSETAKAITEGKAAADISQIAEKEGLHYISTGIFLAEEERYATADDPDISERVAAKVQEIRTHLPASCGTAAAIDRGASWSEISQSAEQDGLHELSALILEAEQAGLED